MARGKTPTGLIENGTKRRQAFLTRRRGFLAKARHLSTLCGVPVAVVCADLDGGAPAVLETRAGVLDRYRALPAAHRAEHTHRRYLEGLLVKERAKLARVLQAGPQALAPPHELMCQLTLEELRRLLASVEAALAAVAERRRALGLPGDDRAVVVPRGDSGPLTAGGSKNDGYSYPTRQQQGQGDHGLFDQPIWPGLRANDGGVIPRDHYQNGTNMMMPPAYEPQPQYIAGNSALHLGGYQQRMPSNGGNYHRRPAPGAYFQPRNAITLPWNGAFQYDGSSSGSSHVGTSSSWMQGPSNGNSNLNNGNFSNGNFNNGAVHALATWRPAESSNTFARYPYRHTISGNNPPRAVYHGQFTGDNNFPNNAPAEFLNMDVGGNGMNYLGLGGYATQGSSNNLQISGGNGMNYLGGYETQGSSNNLQNSGGYETQRSSNNLQYSGASQSS